MDSKTKAVQTRLENTQKNYIYIVHEKKLK